MATSFDPVLLSPLYSADAVGGPDFASAIVRSGQGGAIAHRNINREDFISRYEIDFLELEPSRRRELRDFAVLRQGMARGFRFLPPDDNVINDVVGYLTDAGDIVPIYSTTGATNRFYLVRHYADPGNAYTRWITKPSPLEQWTISIAAASAPGVILASGTFPAGYEAGEFDILPEFRTVILPVYGAITLYYDSGILQFSFPPPAGLRITVLGTFHTAVAFSEDWQKFQIDEVGISEFKIQLEEILPVELGITPEMSLPAFTDTEPPTIPANAMANAASSSQINVSWNPSTDNVGVAGYEVEFT